MFGFKRKKPHGDHVGTVEVRVKMGRVTWLAEAPVHGTYVVEGDTLDDARYDIDYDEARKDAGDAILAIGAQLRVDPSLIDGLLDGDES